MDIRENSLNFDNFEDAGKKSPQTINNNNGGVAASSN